MRIFLTIVFLLVCIVLTGIVLAQQGKDAGLGAIGGIGDTYWGKNKSRSMEGRLVKITTWLAVLFIVLAIILNLNF
ncbi:MAG: preprotein translocase subunit SecG [Lachnospiraceae bacterium]|uniref:preprotein translocase subunit SecG n=1 Tax=Parablautia sp. Marseille-Q6255 TaxID=3039593 RepID=UPI0024BCFD7E|nr:preprotein translocase subunit SecG [Parablautia sp. Marseille-Q6255]